MSEKHEGESEVSHSESMKEDEMVQEKEAPRKISRRDFVKGAALGAGALAGVGALASCGPAVTPAPTATAAATPQITPTPVPAATATAVPEKWDYEADVVVVGYGGAGCVAAITAHDAGAKVLLVEKAPEGDHGGNTRVCGQMWFNPTPVDEAIQYFDAMSGAYGVPADMVQVWAEAMGKNADWVASIGGDPQEINIFNPEFPDLPGSQCAHTYANPVTMQSRLFKLLDANVAQRNIEVLYGSPAKQLVQDCETKEILGVLADQSGNEIAVKASRAVILTCGGFENNQQMIHDYLHWEYGYPKGTPYNTGDGILMAMAAGADLWHMDNVAGPDWNLKVPEYDFAFGYSLYPSPPSWIVVAADSKRYINEKVGTAHGKVQLHDVWVELPMYLPQHMIFDEKVRTAGPLYYDTERFSWYSVVTGYRWSDDNMVEINKGWITQADTIRELAQKINRDPDTLEETVNTYNAACAAGKDPEFGTSPENLVALDTAPFYAMQLSPTFTNTQGGPMRNKDAAVLDTDGNPIPRLYSAGELGSIYGNIYNGGGNVGECISFGQIAAKNAVAETPWG
jgi:succinate dehydrogenase/fumarate reductase flavoprotein subunit